MIGQGATGNGRIGGLRHDGQRHGQGRGTGLGLVGGR